MDFEIADAVPRDAEELLAVKDQGWREAYAHLFSSEFLAGLGREAGRTERWRALLAGEAGGRFAVGRADGRMVGMAGAGPAREGSPAPEEVYTVYVLAEVYGTGLARALTERVIGDRPAFLWVLEDNARAIAFYSKLGFAPDGTRDFFEADGKQVPEIRMVRPGPVT
ncbi:GNAT family N-acetyltransferase [Sinomonas sp. G460-2]|uniref:GNAT family N-acetyltransferase n=1 Tax=Sinomonas sp. G460-2 TaxID=3393464 RepID=UPI0039EF7661